MILSSAWGDKYDRQARLVPGLLTLAPVAVLVVAVGIRDLPVVAVGGGLLTTIGAPILLMNYVRQRGLAAQSSLVEQWGTMPATEMLRLTCRENVVRTETLWRPAVAQLTGADLPTRRQERERPDYADDLISSAIEQLIHYFRRVGMPDRVQAENIS